MRMLSKTNGAHRRDNILAGVSLISGAVAMLVFLAALLIPAAGGADFAGLPSGSNAPDTTPPVITGTRDLTVYIGEAIAYRMYIDVADDSGEATLDVDSSRVDTSKAGVYAVVYTATDPSGNSSSVTIRVKVIKPGVSPDELNSALDGVTAKIIKPGMNKEAKARAVYEYVRNHISYVAASDKSDWRAEAYRALFLTGTGDCFSYFAAAKALLERLDIDTLDIQRSPGLLDETHYWNLINISDDPALERWYHFDTCRLRNDGYNHSGCLLTEAQIKAYSVVRKHFYAYDREGYPQASEEIITPTPEIEDYYGG